MKRGSCWRFLDIYIYITPFILKVNSPKQCLNSNRNKGPHLGSHGTYITSFITGWNGPRWNVGIPTVASSDPLTNLSCSADGLMDAEITNQGDAKDARCVYQVILCHLFGMVKWPFKRLGDLQLRDRKVTLNHLVDTFMWIGRATLFQYSQCVCPYIT